MTTALSGAVEFPAYFLTVYLLGRVSRVRAMAGFMLAGSALLLATVLTSPISSVRIEIPRQSCQLHTTRCTTSLSLSLSLSKALVDLQVLLGKLCISASYSVVFIHSAEVFPTSVRNTSMGVLSVASRFGGILTPFLCKLGDVSANLHFLVFGALMLSSGFLDLFLPETRGLPMPETIDDLLKRCAWDSTYPILFFLFSHKLFVFQSKVHQMKAYAHKTWRTTQLVLKRITNNGVVFSVFFFFFLFLFFFFGL